MTNNTFLRVSTDLFKVGLNPTEILIVAKIIEYNTNTGLFHMTNAQIAELIGVSDRTVDRTLDKLEREGYITRRTDQLPDKRTRTIVFNEAVFDKKLRERQNVGLKNSRTTICQNLDDNLSKSNRQNDIIKEKTKEKEKDKGVITPQVEAEQGTAENPIVVDKQWLVDRHNEVYACANGLFHYQNKYYRM